MRNISSEPQFATFSSVIHQNIDISNSERALKEKEQISLSCHDVPNKISTANDTSEYQSLSGLKEEKILEDECDIQANQLLEPPDEGWGWIICAACFMGE